MELTRQRAKRNRIAIGTRGSKLALHQAEWVKSELLRIHPGLEVTLTKIKTTGDKILDVPLAKVGGKGLFVKELEEALLKGSIDIAVHSMKDLPTDLPSGLHLSAIARREDPRDAFVSRIRNSTLNQVQCEIRNFSDLPTGAIIGTSSLRRVCQLKHLRPDLAIIPLRGNLDTRLRKLDGGQFDAIIVAVAGMKRLGLEERITEILSPEICLPAIGQGAIGIECRSDDEPVNNLVSLLDHKETSICVGAERAFLKRLGGGCQVPIAAHARIVNNPPNPPLLKGGEGGLLIMDGLVGSVSGDTIVKGRREGTFHEPESIGISLAEDLLIRGAGKILAEVYQVP